MATKEMQRTMPNKIKDVASNLMSMPSRMKMNKSMKQANKDVSTLKNARKYKDAPSFDYKDNPNKEAIMARDEAERVKLRLKKK